MDKEPFVKQANNWHSLLSQHILSLSDGLYDLEIVSKFAQNLLYKVIISRMLDAGCGILDAGCWMRDAGCQTDDIDEEILAGCNDILSQIHEELTAWNLYELRPEILSDIYESYLAVKLKKRKGIFYTPGYIVTFIVDHTLGRYLWGTESGRNEGKIPAKKPEDIQNLRILDPACGSGSFLAYAFDVLADFYTFYLPENAVDWLANILKMHLHGIDTDNDAVNITSTILSLKTLDRLIYLSGKIPEFNIRSPLTPLIKGGNSLLSLIKGGQGGSVSYGMDLRHGNFLVSGFTEDKFSMVLGNPPYGVSFNKSEKEIIQSCFETFKSPDSSCLFIEKSVKILEDKGKLGFIVPKSMSYVLSWRNIREFLLKECKIIEIADAKKAFKGVRLEQIVLIAEKNSRVNEKSSVSVLTPKDSFTSHDIDASALTPGRFSMWLGRDGIKDIVDRMWEKSIPLGEIAEIWSGLSKQQQISLSEMPSSENCRICLRGRDIQRYHIRPGFKYVKLKDADGKNSSLLGRYLKPKIVIQDIVAHVMWPTPHIKLISAIDSSKSWVNMNTVTNITCSEYDLEYLCGIMNSRLMAWYVHNFIYNRAARTMHFRLGYADLMPIRSIKSDTPESVSIYDQLVYYVKQMVELCNKTPHAKSEITELDKSIEGIVCRLYGITDEDIKFLRENAGFFDGLISS